MSDYTLAPHSTLICGMQGTGKTTFAFRYLLNVAAACRFIFDDLGQAAARLNLPHASTAFELESAIASKWVCFNPHRMFPGHAVDACRFFCQWSLDVSRRGPGKKVFFADEIWRWQNGHTIPDELAAISQMGRCEDLELMTATQVPNKLNSSIVGSATEAVIFRLDESNALETVEDEYGLAPETVRNLPLGTYIAINRVSRATLTGRIF